MSPLNGERFKQISQAYNTLSNARDRQVYDMEWRDAQRFGGYDQMRRAQQQDGFAGRDPFDKVHKPNRPGSQAHFFDTVFRPRNMVLGVVGVSVFSMVYSQYFKKENEEQLNMKKYGGKAAKVEAWMNPKTKRWEPPAPWDPYYRELNPKLHFVARDQVKGGDR